MDSLPPKVAGAKIAELSPNSRGEAISLLRHGFSSTTAIMLFNLCALHLGDRSIARRIVKSRRFSPPVPATPCHLLRQRSQLNDSARGRPGEEYHLMIICCAHQEIGPVRSGTHKILAYCWSHHLQANQK